MVPNQHINDFFIFLTTAEYSTVWELYNSLNLFPIDRHLGCFQAFAITNCAAVCNIAPTFPPTLLRVFAGGSPRSSSVDIVSSSILPAYPHLF